MSTLVRITVAQDISGIVDLKPDESKWYEEIVVVRPGTAFATPDELEEYAIACASPMKGPDHWFDANGGVHSMEPYVSPETYVMAHFSEDL